MEETPASGNHRRCMAITRDGKRCRSTKLRGSSYCFQHYPKKLLISQVLGLLVGAVLGLLSAQVFDGLTTSTEEQQLAEQDSLLRSRNAAISSLQERNALLERQLSEYGRYVQTTPEGSVIIGKPTGPTIKVAPGASLTVSQHPAFACNIGWTYLQEGKLAAAQELFSQSLAIDSSYYRASLYLAISYLVEGRYMEARKPAESALTNAPNDPEERKLVLLIVGLVAKAHDEDDRAMALFDSALIIDPAYSLALDSKSRIDSAIVFPLGSVEVNIP